ncbi:MAG: amidohydrolase family protein [Parcubacteria group bacterium]
MKIINSHVHLIDLMGMVNKYPDLKLADGISVMGDLSRLLPLLNEEEVIRQMDEAGIEKTVLFAVEAPMVYCSNEMVAGLCQKYPDRFIGFASVDPKEKDAAEVLEKAVTELGLKGLKLHPPLQNFYPNDEAVFSVYEKAQELGIPVVFHVGTTPFGAMCRLDQANPLLLDEVAVKFPDLKIVLTHLGTLWQNEAFMVVEKNPNVYIDTAAYPYELKEILNENMIKRIGENKIIFGTDYPMSFTGEIHTMKTFVELIKDLEISDELKEKIFATNFTDMMEKKCQSSYVTLAEMATKMMK